MAGLFALGGCGYRPVYAGAHDTRYQVVAGHYATASFEAAQVAVAGCRAELGAAHALGDSFPRVVVEVLRVDERSLGVQSNAQGLPLARGTEISVVGRAQVFERNDERPSFDSGDVSRSAQYAAGATAAADAEGRTQAVREAARALGRALGRAVLGLPEPSEG